MITSFRVGAIFQIEDQATPIVARLAGEMDRLAGLVATVRAELQSISSVRIGSLTNRVTALTAAFDRTAVAATAMSTGVASGVAAMDTGLTTALATARALTTQLQAAGRAGAAMRVPAGGGGGAIPPPIPPVPPPLPGPGAGGGGRGGRGGGGHGGRGGGVHARLHAHAGPLSVGGYGGGADMIGTGISAWFLGHAFHEAQEPAHQEALLRMLAPNMSEAEIQQALQQARATSIAVPGSGYGENLKSIGEMYSILGMPHALELSQDFATLDRVMSLSGKGKDEGSGFILARAGEMMGKLNNPEDMTAFRNTLTTMARVGLATHGQVTPEQWLNYVQQAGPAAGTLTDEGMYTTAAIIQVMKGFRAGTAAQALQRQFAGGVMTKSKADELKNLDIFKEGDYTVEKGGHVQFKAGAASEFVGMLQHDPLVAITDVLEPAMEKKGFTTLEDQTREIYKIIGTGPAQREVYDLLRGHKQIVAERDRAKQALAPGAALTFAGANDPTQSMSAFTKAFNDMLGALGGPTLKAAIPAINSWTNFFNRTAQAAQDHPKLAGVFGTVGTGAVAGAVTGLGIGMAGGPIGAGGGALIGAGAGAGVATWGLLPDSVKRGMATGADIGMRTPIPGGAVFGGMLGGMWGGVGGLLPSAGASTLSPTGAPLSTASTTNMHVEISVKAETTRPDELAEQIAASLNKLLTQGHLHNLDGADSTASSPYITGLGTP